MKKMSVFCGSILVSLLGFVAPASAALIDLGSAEDKVFASSTTIILGSEAHIFGDVSASNFLSMASGANIEGNACSNFISKGAGAIINGVNGNTDACDNLNQLGSDISNAASALAGYGVANSASITQTMSLVAGNYWFDDLYLETGETLTINGGVGSTAIINISGMAKLGSGAGIELSGGILSENVFFNFIDNLKSNSFEIGGSEISGTFISNQRNFILGDGAILEDTRFITNGSIIANVQDVKDPKVKVSEPALWGIFLIAAAGLYRRRNNQK